MSIYTQISKRIGWQGYCAIPSVENVTVLYGALVKDKCTESFELVFKIHRFAPPPETPEETRAMCIINEAVKIGTDIFS